MRGVPQSNRMVILRSSSATGAMARQSPLETYPITASTFWRCTKSRYSLTCLVGPPASSMNATSMGRPPMPFFEYGAGTFSALSASAITSAALRAGTPNGPEAGPERKVTTPMRKGLGPAAGWPWASARPPASSVASENNAAERTHRPGGRMGELLVAWVVKPGEGSADRSTGKEPAAPTDRNWKRERIPPALRTVFASEQARVLGWRH